MQNRILDAHHCDKVLVHGWKIVQNKHKHIEMEKLCKNDFVHRIVFKKAQNVLFEGAYFDKFLGASSPAIIQTLVLVKESISHVKSLRFPNSSLDGAFQVFPIYLQ